SAIGAPIGNTFEGGVRIWTSQLTFQAEVAEAQSNFLKAKADASDLRGHNFADWGGNLKESQNGLNQTLNTVTTGTQQQLNNTTGHF
ncbi:MAG: hypothetical protein H7346_13260, partial [Burkholderiaceae bacterium]|nr:hypothetical protein [Burkholderiaceae bacterium]